MTLFIVELGMIHYMGVLEVIHMYSEKEKEQLWINKLDKGTRYVCGEKVIGDYNNLVEYHRKRTLSLGYRSPSFIWKRKVYEHMHRCMMHRERGL